MHDIRFRFRLKDKKDGRMLITNISLYDEANGLVQYPIDLHKWEVLSIDRSLGIYDKNGKEIFENDILIGQRYWVDGYLAKKYPKAIDLYLHVDFCEGNFRLRELEAIDEHKEFEEQKHYRGIGYKNEVSCYSNEDLKLDLYGKRADRRNMTVEVVGMKYDMPHLFEK